MDLRRGNKRVALWDIIIYYTWKNIKTLYKNIKFKILGTTSTEELEMPDGSFSVPDMQDYLEHILKKYETLADKPPVQIYVNKTQTKVTLKI